MSWPIDETYTLRRRELEGLLEEACCHVLEQVQAARQETRRGEEPRSLQPSALITAAVQEALDALWLRALPLAPKEA